MLKKIVCLVLAVLLALPLLTACSKDDDAAAEVANEASRYTTTLNLWVITESELVASVSDLANKGIDPESETLTEEETALIAPLSEEQKETLSQVTGVVKAINKITKAKFKTQLNIKYLTAAQYYTAVEAAFAANEQAIADAKAAQKAAREAMKSGSIATTAEEETAVETFLNEYGVPELKYPEAPDYQVDVLFLGDYQKYLDYIAKGWLLELDSKLADSAVILNQYLNGIFLKAALNEGVTYAVPNNRTIGEYTFLVLDPDLMDELGCTIEDFDSSMEEGQHNYTIYAKTAYQYLNNVHDYNQNYNTGDPVYPIYSESGELDFGLVHYWDLDLDSVAGKCLFHPEKFSLYGNVYNDYAAVGTKLGYNLLLDNKNYMDRLGYKTHYETTADFITNDPEARAAVRVVSGGYELREQYEAEGYTVLTTASPRATNETVYNSMFAVGVYSAEEDRAMEIITQLNTDRELRNLLQYGIENVNYTLGVHTDELGRDSFYVEPTEGNRYLMDVNKTGNLFLAYPEGEENLLVWEYGKKQNLDATTYPTLGLYFDLSTYQLDEDSIRVIEAVSAKLETYLTTAFTCEDDVKALYATAHTKNTQPAEMAAYLLSLVGDVQYTVGTETRIVTAEALATALTYMKKATLDDARGAKQSPQALYAEWITVSGVAATPTTNNTSAG